MSGRGTFVWVTGERYDGEWKEGKENGRGAPPHPHARPLSRCLRLFDPHTKFAYYRHTHLVHFHFPSRSTSPPARASFVATHAGSNAIAFSQCAPIAQYLRSTRLHTSSPAPAPALTPPPFPPFKGTFTWADGSYFDGYWRVGEKHGVGIWCPPPAGSDAVRKTHRGDGYGSPPRGAGEGGFARARSEDPSTPKAEQAVEVMLREYDNGHLVREEAVPETERPKGDPVAGPPAKKTRKARAGRGAPKRYGPLRVLSVPWLSVPSQ